MEENFEELFNNSVKDVKLGKIVTGKVIDITSKNEIIVDLGYKADGIIPYQEYSFEEGKDPRDEFKIGDTITADVLKMNDGLGNVLLSYKKIKSRDEQDRTREISPLKQADDAVYIDSSNMTIEEVVNKIIEII